MALNPPPIPTHAEALYSIVVPRWRGATSDPCPHEKGSDPCPHEKGSLPAKVIVRGSPRSTAVWVPRNYSLPPGQRVRAHWTLVHPAPSYSSHPGTLFPMNHRTNVFRCRLSLVPRTKGVMGALPVRWLESIPSKYEFRSWA